jgi:hypothetical protein
MADGRLLHQHTVPTHYAVALAPDGRSVVTGNRRNSMARVDLQSGQPTAVNADFDDWVSEVVAFDDGSVAGIGRKGHLVVADAQLCTQRSIRVLGDDEFVAGFTLLSQAHAIVSSGGTLRCIDLQEGRTWWKVGFPGCSTGAIGVAPAVDRALVAVATATGHALQFFAPSSGTLGPRYDFRTGTGITFPELEGMWIQWSPQPTLSPDGLTAMANSTVGTLVFLDTANGAPRWEPGRETGLAWVTEARWLGDSNHVLVATADNALALWRLNPTTILWRVPFRVAA